MVSRSLHRRSVRGEVYVQISTSVRTDAIERSKRKNFKQTATVARDGQQSCEAAKRHSGSSYIRCGSTEDADQARRVEDKIERSTVELVVQAQSYITAQFCQPVHHEQICHVWTLLFASS